MNKNIKKNILYIISGTLFVISIVFMILLICLSSTKVTIGKNYTYKFDELGESYSFEISVIFKDEEYMTYDFFIGDESTTITNRYKISSNKNLFFERNNFEWVKFGKINAFEMKLDNKLIEQEYGIDIKMIMECKSSKISRTIYIIFMSIGIVGGIASIIIQYIINKKEKKLLDNNNNNNNNNNLDDNNLNEIIA